MGRRGEGGEEGEGAGGGCEEEGLRVGGWGGREEGEG